MTYSLGIDLGTTYTAAAVERDGRAEVVTLSYRTTSIPTVAVLDEDGTFVIGDAAERRATATPERLAREFKRRVGDPTPLLLGGTPTSIDRLLAEVIAHVVRAVSETEGGPPASTVVTHPANWGPFKRDVLVQALRLAGVAPASLLPEPVAAASWYARAERLAPGATVAVYDLGGGTFDTVVLEMGADGGFAVRGQPEGIERLGGIDIDAAVIGHVLRTLGPETDRLDPTDPATVVAMAQLRRDCVEAKEALSSETVVTIPVLLPHLRDQVMLHRRELEELIIPLLAPTMAGLVRAVTSAGLAPGQPDAVLLVGGASRMPLVAREVTTALGRPVAVDAHPKHPVALGAALVAGARAPASAPGPTPAGRPAGPATAVAAAGAAVAARGAMAPTAAPNVTAPGVTAPPAAAGRFGAGAPPVDRPAWQPPPVRQPGPGPGAGPPAWAPPGPRPNGRPLTPGGPGGWTPPGAVPRQRPPVRPPRPVWQVALLWVAVLGTLGLVVAALVLAASGDDEGGGGAATGGPGSTVAGQVGGPTTAPSDPGGSGGAQLAWTYDLSEETSGSPVTDGQRVYVEDSTARVSAIDMATGAVAWEVDLGQDASGVTPVLAGDALVVSANEPYTIQALDAATGAVRWNVSDVWFYDQPVVVGDAIVVSMGYKVTSLSLADGGERWTVELSDVDQANLWTAQVLAGDVLVAGTDDGHVVGMEAATGDIRFATPVPRGDVFVWNVVMAGGVAVVYDEDGFVTGVNPADGGVLWTLDIAARFAGTIAPLGADALVALDSGELAVIDVTAGVVKQRLSETTVGLVAVPGEQPLAVVAGVDELHALGADGGEAWSAELPFTGQSMAAGGGALAVADGDGNVAGYRLTT
jgi:outer membrane protein assembly factor BamB/actin-like ATPase involved in cell morphogenesis